MLACILVFPLTLHVEGHFGTVNRTDVGFDVTTQTHNSCFHDGFPIDGISCVRHFGLFQVSNFGN